MPIPVGGIATGLDTSAIIQQLLAVERRPVALLEARKAKLQALSTAFREVGAALALLRTRAASLADPATFFLRSVTSSAQTVATAAAGPGNLRGTYTLTVTALARGSVAAAASTTGALTDPVAAGDGAFEFRLGAAGTVVSIPLTAATTLEGLARAINEANAGVRASAINVGTPDAPAYRLAVTSNGTGTANDIVVVSDGTSLAIGTTQTAADAVFAIGGLGEFTRPTNTVSDVIEGVTVTLRAPGATDLGITLDESGIVAAIQALVDAYNTGVRAIDSRTAAAPGADGTPTPGPFGGDVVARRLRLGLSGPIAASGPGAFGALATVGITTARDGTLALDQARLSRALAENSDAVRDLFAGTSATAGVADLLVAALDQATAAVTGTLAVRQDGIAATLRNTQRQIDLALARLDQTERTLRVRFVALERLVSQIQGTGNFLLSQLQSLERSLDRPR
jgi:flagellar hook-associated protein 2